MDTPSVRILVVDDDVFVRDMLADILASHNYRVETAENGVDALETYAQDPHIELIISDMDMPEITGLELIQQLRNNNSDIPIIILTGNDDISIAIEALGGGANDYILKDENIQDTILISVERVLERRRLEERNKQLMLDLEAKNKELENFNHMLKETVGKLTQVGTALSSQRNLSQLLEMIVSESRNVTNADGGTLYILEDNHLSFKIVQNKSKNISLGGTSPDPLNFPPVPLSASNVSSYCAMEKEIINIPDVYSCDDFDFTGPKKYDASTGYQTKSMLVLPMLDRANHVVGVLQLINATDQHTGEITEFATNQVEIASSLASQAGVALDNAMSYEKIERKNIAFERFVPQEFLRQLGKIEVEDIHFGDAALAELSVLFSDIRNFTSLSETMNPDENFLFLNNYLKMVGPVILRHGGFIDKYIGDAIMALFSGTKLGITDDAVTAAVALMEQLREFNNARQKDGLAPIGIGVGVHTGELRLGTVGFEKRMETTVIGDTVNVASRVENLTKRYGTPVIITAITLQGLSDPTPFLVRELDTVQVKGKENAITIYDVFNGDPEGLKERKLHTLPRYLEGISLYKQRQWEDAWHIFTEIQAELPTDKAIDLYLERCCFFRGNPPDASWDGVTRLDEK